MSRELWVSREVLVMVRDQWQSLASDILRDDPQGRSPLMRDIRRRALDRVAEYDEKIAKLSR